MEILLKTSTLEERAFYIHQGQMPEKLKAILPDEKMLLRQCENNLNVTLYAESAFLLALRELGLLTRQALEIESGDDDKNCRTVNSSLHKDARGKGKGLVIQKNV